MNHLIETGAADLINEFWIEFHIQPGFYENGAFPRDWKSFTAARSVKKHLAEQHLGKIKPYLKGSNKLKDERGRQADLCPYQDPVRNMERVNL